MKIRKFSKDWQNVLLRKIHVKQLSLIVYITYSTQVFNFYTSAFLVLINNNDTLFAPTECTNHNILEVIYFTVETPNDKWQKDKSYPPIRKIKIVVYYRAILRLRLCLSFLVFTD